MDYYGLGDAEVCIAAGLPFTRFGQEKAEFKEYLNPGSTDFQYNGKEYNITCKTHCVLRIWQILSAQVFEL